jgi:hypothetical protein
MDADMTQPFATVLAALIAAFLGSWFGAAVALAQFKEERAFERQLDWYERFIRYSMIWQRRSRSH